MSWLPFWTICCPSITTEAELFSQVYESEEPFAEQLRITVLLISTASVRVEVTLTSATGSVGDTGDESSIYNNNTHSATTDR